MHLLDTFSIDHTMNSRAVRLLCRPSFKLSSSRPYLGASSKLGLRPLVLFCGKLTSRRVDVLSSNTLPTNKLAGIPRESNDETTRSIEQESIADDDGVGAKLNSMLVDFGFCQSKWIGSVAISAFCLWRRDGEGMWVGGGAVLNYLLSVALKFILNQERPALASKSDPGMPSSHAQTLFYIVTYAILASKTTTPSINLTPFSLSLLPT
ncbi:Lipid phosphate phosphatase epsilon 1, chloroplastic [Linum grandiflorum]